MKVLVFVALFSLLGSSYGDEALDAKSSALCLGVPPGEVFLFPYPGNCNRFYECINGVAVAQNCPSGLWFNQALQSCDHPDTSGCNNLVCPPTGVDYFPVPGDCSLYLECYHGALDTLSCPDGLWFNRYQKRCVIPEDSQCGEHTTSFIPPWTTPSNACWGVLPGVIELKPYPGDCRRFIECIGSTETVLYCPPYLYFDYNRQMCDQPAVSGCDDTTGTPDPYSTTPSDPPTPNPGFDDPRCDDGNTDYWPHPECSQFIECYEGHGYLMDCPSGLYFNPTDKKCEDPSIAECGRTVPTPDPDTTTRGGGWTPDPDCPWPTPDQYLYPYPGDCTKFLECFYGEKVVQNCPDGLWFNPNLLVCDYPYHAGCWYGYLLEEEEDSE